MFDTERFINEVYSRPCLWNIHLEAYSNKIARQKAWLEIAGVIFNEWDELRPKEQDNKVKALQKKWKSLRDYYNREKHKLDDTQNRCGLRKKRNAPFLKMLQFLSITKTADGSSEDQQNITRTAIITDTTEFRKETTRLMVCQNASIRSIRNQNDTDPNISFLMTVLPEMRTMNEKQNLEFRLEVMNLIKRFKYEDPNEYHNLTDHDSKSWYRNDS